MIEAQKITQADIDRFLGEDEYSLYIDKLLEVSVYLFYQPDDPLLQ